MTVETKMSWGESIRDPRFLGFLLFIAVIFAIGGYSRVSRDQEAQQRLDECLSDHPKWAREYHSKKTSWEDKRDLVDVCLGNTTAPPDPE